MPIFIRNLADIRTGEFVHNCWYNIIIFHNSEIPSCIPSCITDLVPYICNISSSAYQVSSSVFVLQKCFFLMLEVQNSELWDHCLAVPVTDVWNLLGSAINLF
jgi:hypothetical protein